MFSHILKKLKEMNSNENPPPPYEEPTTEPFEPNESQVIEAGSTSSDVLFTLFGHVSEPICLFQKE